MAIITYLFANCNTFRKIFTKIFLGLENENFSAYVIPHKDDTSHNHFREPFRPRRTEKSGYAKEGELGDKRDERDHTHFRNQKPDDADDGENRKGFFRADFLFILHLPKHEFHGENPIHGKSRAKTECRRQNQRERLPPTARRKERK